MNRVLIICKDFPPSNVIGARRPESWMKYLPVYGIDADVVTATYSEKNDPGIFRVATDLHQPMQRSLLKLLRRRFRSLLEFWLPFLIPVKSRYVGVLRQAELLLNERKYDAIIATAEPYILFAFASELSWKYRTCWIADYRDIWSNHPKNSRSGMVQSLLYKYLYSYCERKWLKNASIIITASESYVKPIMDATGAKDVKVILNGHDIPLESIHVHPDHKVMKIAYSGRLYPFQPIEDFIKALDNFYDVIGIDCKTEVHFFGMADWPESISRIRRVSLRNPETLIFHPVQPYKKYIEQLTQCSVFLLLTESNEQLLAAKVFDYIPLQGDILVYPKGVGVMQVLLNQRSGVYIAGSVQDITNYLTAKYRSLSGVMIEPRISEWNHTHRKFQTESLAKYILQISEQ